MFKFGDGVKRFRDWREASVQQNLRLVFGDEFLTQGLHLKSHQRC